MGALRPVQKDELHCVLPLQCAPKKNGKIRLIVDCRYVNQFIVCPSFSQEGIEKVAEQIQEHDELFSLDVTKCFHHVAIRDQHQKYLGVQWRGRYFCWQVMPFGVKCAPYYFNKIMREMLGFLRENLIRCTIFVDDLFVMAKKSCATDHRDFCPHTMEDLGWEINRDKCALSGGTKGTHIGFVVQSVSDRGPWLSVLPTKIKKLKRSITGVLQSSNSLVAVRQLARIAGQCVAMLKAVLPARLLLRNLYRVISTRQDWNSVVCMDDSCKRDLLWWKTAVQSWNGAPLLVKQPDIQLQTDASGSGWGGVGFCTMIWQVKTILTRVLQRLRRQQVLGRNGFLWNSRISGSFWLF